MPPPRSSEEVPRGPAPRGYTSLPGLPTQLRASRSSARGVPPSRARSALVVPPDFDGLLRAELCRLVASCSRSWGSHRFRLLARILSDCSLWLATALGLRRPGWLPEGCRGLLKVQSSITRTARLPRVRAHPSKCSPRQQPCRVTAVGALSSLAGPHDHSASPLRVRPPAMGRESARRAWPALSSGHLDLKAFIHCRVRCVRQMFPSCDRPILPWASATPIFGYVSSC